MPRRVFIIGTGRNGSKLLAECLKTGDNVSVYGEVDINGPEPIWYKELYEGIGNRKDRMVRFKALRNERFTKSKAVYVEKNHLLNVILHEILEMWPDALFLYLKRNSKKTIRSFLKRDYYSEKDLQGEYGKGRIRPVDHWGDESTFEKCCWLYTEYTWMCLQFKKSCPEDQFRTIKYSQLINKDQPSFLKGVFNFCGIEDFNEFRILSALSKPMGTDSNDQPDPKDWSKEWKKIHKSYISKLKKEFVDEYA